MTGLCVIMGAAIVFLILVNLALQRELKRRRADVDRLRQEVLRLGAEAAKQDALLNLAYEDIKALRGKAIAPQK